MPTSKAKKTKLVQIIDGKALAEAVLLDIRKKIIKTGITPGLAVVLIGDDPASILYVRNKEKACHKVGMTFHKYLCNRDCYPEITEKEILEMIDFLNRDPQTHGIIVQLPLPKKFDTQKIINAIDPEKDADGFHPANIKKILAGQSTTYPPLVKTVLYILKSQNIKITGKKVAIISRSEIFYPVIIKALENEGAQAVVVLPEKYLQNNLQDYDIIISALGQPGIIKGGMIKKDSVLIDIGITKTNNGFSGDVDFDSIKKVAKFVTPTPGGTGPMTVAMLLDSTFNLAMKQSS